jgi:predicted alpha/beta-hydrolase family hydrolase
MNNYQEFRDDSPNQLPVRGFLHGPRSGGDWLVLTHGAGSNCNAPLLVDLAGGFSASGLTVLRCDLPFRQSRPHGPPPRGSSDRDQAGIRAAIACARRETSGRVFLGGHSYGGRQSSILASEEARLVDCLLLLSYPLHPPQKPGELRTAHFSRLEIPALFVHGTSDGFGSNEELASALKLIPARTELLSVTGAGHELLNKTNHHQLPGRIVEVFRSFAGLV